HAISSARHIIVDSMNPECDRLMLSLPIEGTIHRSPWPFVHPASYQKALASDRAPDVHWRSEVDRIRSTHDFVLVSHGRHYWKRGDLNDKNTHHLLIGFAEFTVRHPEAKACLVTLEYGKDV